MAEAEASLSVLVDVVVPALLLEKLQIYQFQNLAHNKLDLSDNRKLGK